MAPARRGDFRSACAERRRVWDPVHDADDILEPARRLEPPGAALGRFGLLRAASVGILTRCSSARPGLSRRGGRRPAREGDERRVAAAHIARRKHPLRRHGRRRAVRADAVAGEAVGNGLRAASDFAIEKTGAVGEFAAMNAINSLTDSLPNELSGNLGNICSLNTTMSRARSLGACLR